MSKPVLFQTIQLSIDTQFECQNSSISNNSDQSTKSNGLKYCYVLLTIQLSISNLFIQSQKEKHFYFKQFSLA